MVQFQKATKQQARLRLALSGPSGSGKTYSALAIATSLGAKVAAVDTEHGSASKYAGDPFTFDVLQLTSFHPDRYLEAIKAAEDNSYDVLVIDSLSHAWIGKDGELELKDRASARQGENSFTAWRHVTPLHNALVDAILSSPLHIVVTMRAKTEYVTEKDANGRTTIRKIGLAPVMRDGIEYEFDVFGDLDANHNLLISKTRCRLLDGKTFRNPGKDVADILTAWLSDGEPPPPTVDAAIVKTLDGMLDTLFGQNGQRDKALDKIEAEFGTRDLSRLTVDQAAQLEARLGGAIEKKAAEA
jgi:DNA polymerase III delta prime subunit